MGLSGMFGRFSNAARTVLPGIDPKKKPVAPSTLTAPPPKPAANLVSMPASVRESGATSAAAAIAASAKARKKGAAASTSSIAKPTGTILTSTATPKTLLGY